MYMTKYIAGRTMFVHTCTLAEYMYITVVYALRCSYTCVVGDVNTCIWPNILLDIQCLCIHVPKLNTCTVHLWIGSMYKYQIYIVTLTVLVLIALLGLQRWDLSLKISVDQQKHLFCVIPMQVSVCLNYKMIGKRQLYYILKRATHALKYTMYTIAQNTSLILNFIIFLLKNDPYMHVQIVEDYIDA